MPKAKPSVYDASKIKVLEGLEPVRKRPGMFIGSTDGFGLQRLAIEIIDNSVDEAIAGFAQNIWVKMHRDGRISVTDDGRGIPVKMHQSGVSALEVAMTKLHAGAKFDDTVYQASGGLHGVGASAVNALSSFMRVEVKRDNKVHAQEYKRGKPTFSVKELTGKELKESYSQKFHPQLNKGTTTIFIPDKKVFGKHRLSFNKIKETLKERSYLLAGLFCHLWNEETNTQSNFYFDGGIQSLVRHLNRNKKVLHPPIYLSGQKNSIGVEVAIQYNDGFSENIKSFANVINTKEGGTHLTGFRMASTRAIKDYAIKNKIGNEITGEDLKEGLSAVVFIKMTAKDIQFEGQTKSKLNNPEAQSAVFSVVKEGLEIYFEEHPQETRRILEKVFLAARARLAARAARETVIRKTAFGGTSLPGKLADCQETDPKKSELYIVEGDSAGGCFSGKTKVALADGRNISFIQLVKEEKAGKKNYCYTILPNGEIGIEKIVNPRRTKKKAEVIKIELDNREEIICTPDHLFLLSDRTYKQAQYLTKNDSLMPLYRKLSKSQDKGITIDGYEMAYDLKRKRWVFTHLLADAYNLKNNIYKKKDCSHKHHKDFNKLNNNPNNIQRVTEDKHLEIHQKVLKKTIHRPDVKKKTRELHQAKGFREKIRKIMTKPKMRKLLSKRAKRQWANSSLRAWRAEKTKEQWTEEFMAQRKKIYNQTYYRETLKALRIIWRKYGKIDESRYDDYRLSPKKPNLLKLETFCHRFFDDNQKLMIETIRHSNHKIRKIVKLKTKQAIYDLEVPQTHNFALASGVFVHNSAKQARDRRSQAILPIGGKILNTERARLDKIIKFQELRDLIMALGMGIGESLKPEKLRYHRIIIMVDADVDGEHIATLLLTFFYRHLKSVIENGYLYLALPPLYKIQIGKNIYYAYSDEEKEKVLKEKGDGKVSIQRYKGLGEMNPEQLWETTMNPATRILKQIAIEDATLADEVFTTLMGKEVFPRKRFIQTHAKLATLDI